MPKLLDPVVIEILKKYELNPKEALWDCHGVWIIYHRYVEQAGAKAGVVFDAPSVLEWGLDNRVAMLVTGAIGDKTEWSVGEAAPANNKNPYVWAMAEKRGRDRVILKLLGLHGFVYSEEEADDFKGSKPAEPPAPEWKELDVDTLYASLYDTVTDTLMWKTRAAVATYWNDPSTKKLRSPLPKELIDQLVGVINATYPKETTDSNATPKT